MKKGSALLVVLGMIAFMVVSAVAFSAWMRSARLPSSYLRRSSASRHLVKAALAQAVEIIDISIGNNPHPGIGTRAYANPRIGGRVDNRNYWRNNCFIGTNRLVSAENTVSTLTLEGLAYVPPALINEARYYSRHSAAATWRNLGFDSGRYAFSAIDVSDHFDVNRVFADRGRSSADKGKVSLAHVFENASHTGAGNPAPSVWDAFIEKFNNVEKLKLGEPGANVTGSIKLPLISLADLNLALNKEDFGDILSPFCRYFGGGSDFAMEIDANSPVAMMNFVTDSYFPSGASTNWQYNILCQQPFRNIPAGRNDRQKTLIEILETSNLTELGVRMNEHLSGLDMVSLYDYLDGNNVPASLALPTTERVPMICGLQPAITFDLKPTMSKEPEIPDANADNAQPQVIINHVCKLEFSNPVGSIGSLVMFPFRRDKDIPNVSYTVEYALRIGLSIGGGPGMRTGGASAYIIGDNSDFEKKNPENGVIKLYKQVSGSAFSDVTDESSAVKLINSPISPGDFADTINWFQNNAVFSVPHIYELKTDPVTGNKSYEDKGPSPTENPMINAAFHPLNADGTGDGGFNAGVLRNLGSAAVLPFVTVTARIRSQSKTVDMVPATFFDDNTQNGVANDPNIGNINGGANQRPLITLKTQAGSPFAFGEGAFSAGQSVNFTMKFSGGESIVCPDPRWNFAPENFYVTSDALQAGTWFADKCGAGGGSGRDGDIFMFVGNQGYMQSISEVAFLPRTQVDFGGGDMMLGNCGASAFNIADFKLYPGANSSFEDLAHGRFMWKTYRLYAQGGLAAEPIYDMGVVTDGSGFRINPYTASRNIMMAAIANTPYSWWAASTNNQEKAMEECNANEFNSTYAFSEMNNSAKMGWEDLKKVAGNLMSAMQHSGINNGNWERGFASLDWAGENDDICGKDGWSATDDLMEVDRKFLYGFWRDTFAVKQQLFLVFVRAEPLMMGGGAAGQSPPQLGARAVALVWRDPTPTAEDVSGQPRPHRTRVLFYRQFD